VPEEGTAIFMRLITTNHQLSSANRAMYPCLLLDRQCIYMLSVSNLHCRSSLPSHYFRHCLQYVLLVGQQIFKFPNLVKRRTSVLRSGSSLSFRLQGRSIFSFVDICFLLLSPAKRHHLATLTKLVFIYYFFFCVCKQNIYR
jgi:hypothetical protein